MLSPGHIPLPHGKTGDMKNAACPGKGKIESAIQHLIGGRIEHAQTILWSCTPAPPLPKGAFKAFREKKCCLLRE
jgi:hypothetical protein